jgi:formylmethanofuran dehydrogenase subunit A
MPKMRALHDELVELDKIFDKVKQTFIKGEAKTVEKDGQLIIQQGDITETEMSKEVLDEITAKITAIRNKVVN